MRAARPCLGLPRQALIQIRLTFAAMANAPLKAAVRDQDLAGGPS
jgi:hypothetical protein